MTLIGFLPYKMNSINLKETEFGIWNHVFTTQSIIGTKWVFRNKLDDSGMIVRNKARLVCQGLNQQEGIDYDETLL